MTHQDTLILLAKTFQAWDLSRSSDQSSLDRVAANLKLQYTLHKVLQDSSTRLNPGLQELLLEIQLQQDLR